MKIIKSLNYRFVLQRKLKGGGGSGIKGKDGLTRIIIQNPISEKEFRQIHSLPVCLFIYFYLPI